MSMRMMNFEEILLRVPMCCNKCEEKVREELLDLEGVYSFTCDQRNQTVSVIGNVDPFQVLKKMKRIKRKSEFWSERNYINRNHMLHVDNSYIHNTEPVYRASYSQRQFFNESPSRTSYWTPHEDSLMDSPARYSPPSCTSYWTPYGDSLMDSPARYSPPSRTSYWTPYGDSLMDSPARYSSASPPFRLPYSQCFNQESAPPYAQTYYTEEYPSYRYWH